MQNSNSEYIINKNSKTLIISFGGYALKFGGILPFEFLNFLNKHFEDVDKIFYIDKHHISYHKGIDGITKNIDETVIYLKEKIKNYEKVIFMGISAGGYASLLFGSLLNVTKVIAFIPQTILKNQLLIKNYDKKYINLKNIINKDTKYYVYGDLSITHINDSHHISQVTNIEHFPNVTVYKRNSINIKNMKNSGELLNILQNIINH